MDYYVKFNKDCIYVDTSNDRFDVNKLFGFSIGYHHTNSHRFGWNVLDGKINIYSYSYVNKKRVIKQLCIIEPEKRYKFSIIVKGSNTFFNILDDDYILSQVVVPMGFEKKVWGYKLWPYFGGNKVSPQTIHITLNHL